MPVAPSGWPMRDGAAVDVELCLVEAELADAGQGLRAERLVDLDAVDLVERQAGGVEHGADGGRRADAHDLGRHADAGAGDGCARAALPFACVPTMIAPAPSTMADELPPVWTPPKAGFSFASTS